MMFKKIGLILVVLFLLASPVFADIILEIPKTYYLQITDPISAYEIGFNNICQLNEELKFFMWLSGILFNT